ncbi:MAG: hypothetical protein KGI25_09870, partial [Thaumarchaeota archaeon]|nr:hypothetical protein [Nitrososphaerota archaeon]
MCATVAKKYDYLTELKSNYRQRIKEADEFSKHFSESSSKYRSEFLTQFLDLCQYYVDLQKKFTAGYPKWYDESLMTKNSQIITEILTQTIHNMDLFYSEFMDYTSKNARIASRIGMQLLQMSERYHDMFEDIPQLKRDTFIELIKEAKQYDDRYVKENGDKETNSHQ